MENNYDVLVGRFTYVVYKSDNYMVTKFLSEDGPITTTGPSFDIDMSQDYELFGNYTDHPKYGFQFNYLRVEKHLSTNREQIISFLKSDSFKGVGKKAAEKIYNFFEDNTLHILKEDPKRIFEVELTDKQYNAIIVGFESLNNPQNEIMFHLVSSGFTSIEAQRIFNRFKYATLEVSDINPFRFYNEIYGMSFEKVTNYAKTKDFEDKENKYKEAYLIYLLTKYCFESGDTFIDRTQFMKLSKLSDFDSILENAINNDYIVLEGERVYLFNDYNDEIYISNYLNNFGNELSLDDELLLEGISNNENELQVKYDSKQKDAISSFFKNGISIIVGGPGTGKTTIVKTMANMFKAYFPFNNLIAIAPTGRAAKRISEICDCEAKTIHSLLRWNLETNTFVYDEDNPVVYDAIIIDEFSMVDANLFASLLKACKYVKKICIIGDDNQLPSIRPGFVLRDLIESNKFMVSKLTYNYRQSEGNEIIDLANSIIDDTVDLSKYHKDIEFIDMKKRHFDLVSLIQKDVENGYEFDDIQVLAPMYRGDFGIDKLNITLQNAFNPDHGQPSKNVGKYTYRVSDKILQLKNRPNDDVYNGDIGYLTEIDFDEKCFVINYNDVYVFYKFDDLIDISLAYAISVHKSQGSEYRAVYFVFTRSNIHMLNKNLIYTAISRAKNKLVLIGEESVFVEGIHQMMRNRHTTLKDRLINCVLNSQF